jgi:riboflavin synthase alpha subunit
MFTGLIRATGRLLRAEPFGGGRRLSVDLAGLEAMPATGASVAVNGVCLTVTRATGTAARFDAVEETISRTTLADAVPGALLNLEPALRLGEPLDGHLVQGHVDAVAEVLETRALAASRVLRLRLPRQIAPLVAPKGSVTIDGVSLTVTEVRDADFSVSVIPHTAAVTTLGALAPGARVNLEADLLARYLARLAGFTPTAPGGAAPADAPSAADSGPSLDEATLRAFLAP